MLNLSLKISCIQFVQTYLRSSVEEGILCIVTAHG